MSPRKITVTYGHITTKVVGEVWVAERARGIWTIHIDTTRDRFLDRLQRDGVEAVADERQTAGTRRALREYFAGKRRRFDCKIDWSRLQGFDRRALQVCAKIPYGKVMSYGEIARRAGSPGGARAAGQAMGKNPFALVVPCHRVIKSDGSLGGYGGGELHKRALLDLEGVVLPKERIMRMPRRPFGLRI
ncbi:MAG TPA: methylated-DNA--[protein]-cysteine S-methyltransferase [Acidobacteriota bacterium]|nr:methylated-DNA--[protein]-cysteine S-methyltransferase [Acidobacteriota bacterium]